MEDGSKEAEELVKSNNAIGIIGAGWLGKDWIQFLANSSHLIRYTKRNDALELQGDFFSFSFGNSLPHSFYHELEFLFITAPIPQELEWLDAFINELSSSLSRRCKIVFASTIGVYAAEAGEVNESSECLNDDSAYAQFERALVNAFPQQVTVIRLGGLLGDDRHPVYRLSQKSGISDGQKAVNLIHKGDILQFFWCIVIGAVPSGIYNLVYPNHPNREEYYIQKAIELKLPVPIFDTGEMKGKVVCSEKSQTIPGFEYRFPI